MELLGVIVGMILIFRAFWEFGFDVFSDGTVPRHYLIVPPGFLDCPSGAKTNPMG